MNTDVQFKEVGNILREARQKKGFSLRDISEHLKIREKYLRAVEAGNAEEIPGSAYLFGYLKSYAEFLEADITRHLDYIRDSDHAPSYQEVDFSIAPSLDSSHPKQWIVASSILGCLLIVLFQLYYEKKNSTFQQQLPYQLIEEKNKQHSVNQKNQKLLYNHLEAQQDENLHTQYRDIVLLAKEATWIMVRDIKGQLLSRHHMKRGETYFLSDEAGIILSAEKPKAIEVLTQGTLADLGALSIQNHTSQGNLSQKSWFVTPIQ